MLEDTKVEEVTSEEGSVEDSKKPGKFICLICNTSLADMLCVLSYSCGGVGHLSRDCVQGSKCYNCSGVVSYPTS